MAKIINPSFGKRLRELRKSAGLSQKELAAKLGIVDRTVRRLEHGDYLPGTKMQVNLATIFGITVDELLGGDGLVGVAEVLRVLRPYVELFLSSIAKKMREIGEEILKLQMQPIIDDHDKHRIEILMEKLRGSERYFAEIWRDLCDLERQNEKRLS